MRCQATSQRIPIRSAQLMHCVVKPPIIKRRGTMEEVSVTNNEENDTGGWAKKGPVVPLDPKVQGGGFAHEKRRQVGGHQHAV
jgi:hypothetical protein